MSTFTNVMKSKAAYSMTPTFIANKPIKAVELGPSASVQVYIDALEALNEKLAAYASGTSAPIYRKTYNAVRENRFKIAWKESEAFYPMDLILKEHKYRLDAFSEVDGQPTMVVVSLINRSRVSSKEVKTLAASPKAPIALQSATVAPGSSAAKTVRRSLPTPKVSRVTAERSPRSPFDIIPIVVRAQTMSAKEINFAHCGKVAAEVTAHISTMSYAKYKALITELEKDEGGLYKPRSAKSTVEDIFLKHGLVFKYGMKHDGILELFANIAGSPPPEPKKFVPKNTTPTPKAPLEKRPFLKRASPGLRPLVGSKTTNVSTPIVVASSFLASSPSNETFPTTIDTISDITAPLGELPSMTGAAGDGEPCETSTSVDKLENCDIPLSVEEVGRSEDTSSHIDSGEQPQSIAASFSPSEKVEKFEDNTTPIKLVVKSESTVSSVERVELSQGSSSVKNVDKNETTSSSVADIEKNEETSSKKEEFREAEEFPAPDIANTPSDRNDTSPKTSMLIKEAANADQDNRNCEPLFVSINDPVIRKLNFAENMAPSPTSLLAASSSTTSSMSMNESFFKSETMSSTTSAPSDAGTESAGEDSGYSSAGSSASKSNTMAKLIGSFENVDEAATAILKAEQDCALAANSPDQQSAIEIARPPALEDRDVKLAQGIAGGLASKKSFGYRRKLTVGSREYMIQTKCTPVKETLPAKRHPTTGVSGVAQRPSGRGTPTQLSNKSTTVRTQAQAPWSDIRAPTPKTTTPIQVGSAATSSSSSSKENSPLTPNHIALPRGTRIPTPKSSHPINVSPTVTAVVGPPLRTIRYNAGNRLPVRSTSPKILTKGQK